MSQEGEHRMQVSRRIHYHFHHQMHPQALQLRQQGLVHAPAQQEQQKFQIQGRQIEQKRTPKSSVSHFQHFLCLHDLHWVWVAQVKDSLYLASQQTCMSL